MRLAVVDLGSNSFHSLVADVSTDGEITKVGSHKETLELGSLVAAHGIVPRHAWLCVLDCARELCRASRALGAERLAVVGTSALREADNGAALARALTRAMGCPLEILSGDEEAELAYRGARARLAGLPERVSVIDLGGGSVEVAAGDRRRVSHTASLPLGFLRVMQRLGCAGTLDRAARIRVSEYVHEHTAQLLPVVSRCRPEAWVLSGGAARALSTLWPTAAGLSVRLLRAVADELSAVPPALLVARGCNPARAGNIGLASHLLALLAERFGAERVRISPGGLREGVLLREYERARLGSTSAAHAALVG